ncbi:cardiolipin-specific deacylase 1, mitochondrial [[Candida] jaroonii]|uniref:Cardiolipin-specific deacylase 1, mitochondrial n=1 Tax=[Candida] jaroonii TaxID=467808 RepID=A0ACA9Y5U7_9ASCO|nr:cardiolipin-specific deacylase 1, mitochondrial [[Candida] jaroonii]
MSSTEVEVDELRRITPEYGEDARKNRDKNEKMFPKTYGDSFKDWLRHSWKVSDQEIEHQFLSMLSFYPKSDGKRTAKIIDTPVGDKNFIHEFYIENTETETTHGQALGLKDQVKDIVIVHGYGASLGLFLFNFGHLSSIPGIRIHAIDLLGFGLSARPSFPKFKNDTVEQVEAVENWFIDSLEEWRIKRKINNFVLIGHSFGGYLSSCYAMKYHKIQNPILNKLVLVSPVGVERNRHSLLKNLPNPYFDDSRVAKQNENDETTSIKDQPQINPNYENLLLEEDEDAPKSFRINLVRYLWNHNISPLGLVRNLGPFRSRLISAWTSRRFSKHYVDEPDAYTKIHDYCYRIFNAKGSGEFAITRILGVGALARLPLMDRMPQFLAKNNLPSLWMYGDKDWMNVEAGREMALEINELSKKQGISRMAGFKILNNAGHHLYMDNPEEFKDSVFKFLEYKE